MNHWLLSASGNALDGARVARQRSLATVIGAIGRPAFAQATLAALQPLLPAGSWSVYRLWPAREPELHLSASHGVQDTTRDCFAAYRAGLYRRDRSFDPVRGRARPGDALLLRLTADEVPNAEHREAIYRRHGLSARLSLTQLAEDGSLLALNLYRHGGDFDDGAVEHLGELGPMLLAAVARHLGPPAGAAPAIAAAAGVASGRSGRERLQAACPALTGRELDVCERLLRGMTYDGIAADLGLSVPTVKTYRARAFDRLGLHFRHQLHDRLGPH